MAFWSSLIFTGARVAGQRERQTQAYEAGTTYFPRDYPFTSAHEEFSKGREAELKDKWDRKPPAKRTNFEKLLVQDPFSPNWNDVLGIQSPKDKEDLVSTQREAHSDTRDVKPWLLRGTNVAKIVQELFSSSVPADYLVGEINRVRATRRLGPLQVTGPELLRGALVVVKVNVCGRGLPQDLALIYMLDNEEVTRAVTSSKQQQPKGGDDEDNEVSQRCSLELSYMHLTSGGPVPRLVPKERSHRTRHHRKLLVIHWQRICCRRRVFGSMARVA